MTEFVTVQSVFNSSNSLLSNAPVVLPLKVTQGPITQDKISCTHLHWKHHPFSPPFTDNTTPVPLNLFRSLPGEKQKPFHNFLLPLNELSVRIYIFICINILCQIWEHICLSNWSQCIYSQLHCSFQISCLFNWTSMSTETYDNQDDHLNLCDYSETAL